MVNRFQVLCSYFQFYAIMPVPSIMNHRRFLILQKEGLKQKLSKYMDGHSKKYNQTYNAVLYMQNRYPAAINE